MARMTQMLAVCGAVLATHSAAAQSGISSDARIIQIAPPASAPAKPATGDAATGSLPPPPAPEQPAVPEKAPEIQIPESHATESLPQNDVPRDNAAVESKPAEKGESRFTFTPLSDGYVRLDNRTGEVAFCSKRTVGWTCQVASEDRGRLENEIARLQAETTALKEENATQKKESAALNEQRAGLVEENVALKKELLAKELPPPDIGKDEPPVEKKAEPPAASNETVVPPGDPNIDRVKVMVEKAWRQLVDMVTALQKEILKKS